MLFKNLRILAIVAICSTLSFEGAVIGYARGLHQIQTRNAKLNRLAIEWELVIQQAEQALNLLYACDYLAETRPEAYAKVPLLARSTIKLAYAPEYNRIFIAAAEPETNTILLSDHFFDLPYEERIGVFVHEYLHLLGLPRHKEYLIRSQDAVYITAAKCFAGDLQHDAPARNIDKSRTVNLGE